MLAHTVRTPQQAMTIFVIITTNTNANTNNTNTHNTNTNTNTNNTNANRHTTCNTNANEAGAHRLLVGAAFVDVVCAKLACRTQSVFPGMKEFEYIVPLSSYGLHRDNGKAYGNYCIIMGYILGVTIPL